MAIVVNLDVMMAKRKKGLTNLSRMSILSKQPKNADVLELVDWLA